MRYLTIILITMFIFAACAQKKIWYSPEKSVEQTKADYKECESYMLEQDYALARLGPPPQQYFDSCMGFKGYSLADALTLEAQGAEYYKVPR